MYYIEDSDGSDCLLFTHNFWKWYEDSEKTFNDLMNMAESYDENFACKFVRIGEEAKVKVKTVSRGSFTPTEYWNIIRCARKLAGKVHPEYTDLRKHYRLRTAENTMPVDLQWAIRFMVNSFIRPSDLKTLKHRHIEIAQKSNHTYLRLTLPETKSHGSPIATLRPAVTVYKSIVAHYQPNDLANPDDYIFIGMYRDWETDRKSTRLNSSHSAKSRMPSSA